MTDTPRTGNGEWCHADFARELERDLAQRTADRDALEAESFSLSAEISRVRLVELAKAIAERDALAADLVAAQGYRSAAEESARRAREITQSMIAERDEARREACELLARSMKGPMEIAAERGWNCFDAKEER